MHLLRKASCHCQRTSRAVCVFQCSTIRWIRTLKFCHEDQQCLCMPTFHGYLKIWRVDVLLRIRPSVSGSLLSWPDVHS